MAGLSDYLTSDYIRSLKYYALDRTRDIVMAYVEGDDDLHFWKSALDGFGNTEKYRFEVVTNKMSNENLDAEASNGKAILLNMHNLGRNKVVCVDADWDLLVDNYSDYTEIVRNNMFVINTTYYSLENILLCPEFHASLMRQLQLNEVRIEYENLLEWTSHLCESIFVLMLSYAKKDSLDRFFWFDNFGQCINCVSANDLGDVGKMDSYICIWEKKNASFICNQAVSMQQVRKELDDKGYLLGDLWKLMRGHNLYASIIKPWIKRKYKLWRSSEIETYKERYGTVGLCEFCKSLGSYLGEYKSVDDAIDVYFYNNFSNPIWLPEATKRKILSLFS